METKFTKGEWILSEFYDGFHIYSIGKKVCSIWSGLVTRSENKANAKLIAAAPDLFNALNELIDFHKSDMHLKLPVLEEAIKALKKATE